MNMYRLNHQQLLKGVRYNFLRYLYKEIQWDNRLIGILGAQGVGKTTLLLQRIKQAFGDSEKALYLSLDSILFQQDKLTTVATHFYKEGGTHLFLDSVHRYADWIPSMRKIMESCPNLHVVFAASSLLTEAKIKKGLKDLVKCYTLNTMSFREYLDYESLLEMNPVPLDDLLTNNMEIARNINDQLVVAPIFKNYLEHGCYPFYWDDPDAYPFRLHDRIRDSIDIDLPAITSVEYVELEKIKKMMMLIVNEIPNVSRLVELSEKMHLDRSVADKYFNYLKGAGGLHHLPVGNDGPGRIQKTFLANTNLLTAFNEEQNDRVIVGETFFVDQMLNCGFVELMDNNDFLVNDKYTFLIGDPLRDYDRIRDQENAFAAIYGQPKSINNKIPIWLLGLCY